MPALLCFAVACAAYAWTAAPAPGWLDAPEFVAAAAGLGIPHPPGHPLPVLLGHAVGLVPVGSWAFRVALASALAGAFAVAGVCAAGSALLERLIPGTPRRSRDLLAALTALAFGATWAAWFQAVRPEVYALEIALLAWTIALALGPSAGRARIVTAVGLCVGLGVANHHFMTALVAAPVGVWLLVQGARRRAVLWGIGATALGSLAYVQLFVRAAKMPWPNWGDPATPDRLAWVMSAKAFQKSVGLERSNTASADAAQALGALVEGWGILPSLIAVLGIYVLVRNPATRALGTLFTSVAGITLAGRAILGFDVSNPDAHGYLLPAFVAFALLGLAAIAVLVDTCERARASTGRLVAHAVSAALALLIGVQGAANAGSASLRSDRASEIYLDRLYEPLPPGALLITSYFETTFLTWYAAVVEARRPDVAILDRAQLSYPGNARVTKARHPELASLIDAPLRVGAPTPIAALDVVAAQRAVFFELHFTLEPALDSRIHPLSLTAQWLPAGEEKPAGQLPDLRATGPADTSSMQRVLLWHAVQRIELFCRRHERALVAADLELARAMAPEDGDLQELAARCLP